MRLSCGKSRRRVDCALGTTFINSVVFVTGSMMRNESVWNGGQSVNRTHAIKVYIQQWAPLKSVAFVNNLTLLKFLIDGRVNQKWKRWKGRVCTCAWSNEISINFKCTLWNKIKRVQQRRCTVFHGQSFPVVGTYSIVFHIWKPEKCRKAPVTESVPTAVVLWIGSSINVRAPIEKTGGQNSCMGLQCASCKIQNHDEGCVIN